MSTWNWKRGLLGAGLVLAGGCNLGDLVDEEAFLDKFKGVQIPQAGIDEVTKKIGAMGGQAVTMDGAVTIPEGALSDDVDITVKQADPEAIVAPLPSVLKPVSAPVSFKPDGTKFDEPVTISLFHNKSADPPEQPVVVWLENEKDTSWDTVKSEDTYTDNDKGVTQANVTHFSVYAVVDCVAAGPLAHLCQDLIDGKISLKDVLTSAPPAEDTWGGVVAPRPDDGNSGADAGTPDPTDGYDCRRCLEIAQKCQQDPRQDICEDAAKPCTELAPRCAEELGCDQLAVACNSGVPEACQEFDRRCDGPALGHCDQLELDCQNRKPGACDAFERECGTVQPSCEWLSSECHRGNQAACADYDQLCAVIDECGAAKLDCEGGNQDACDYYDANCGTSTSCDDLAYDCEYNGNQDACYAYEEQCGTSTSCDDLAYDCEYNGNQSACDQYQQECTVVSVSCEDLAYDCEYNGNQSACDEYQRECAGGEPDCSAHYELCYGPEASVEDCYAYDTCMGFDVDPNCHYERTCYPAGCEGDVCWPEECDVENVCEEPPPNQCDQLWEDCYYYDDPNACEAYNSICVGGGGGDGGVEPPPPPPPQECMQLWDACQNDNFAACEEFDSKGCPPPPPPT